MRSKAFIYKQTNRLMKSMENLETDGSIGNLKYKKT